MYGIDKLKEAIDKVCGFQKAFADAYADKKISVWEAIGLAPKVFGFIPLVQDAGDIFNEIKDLDDPERAELNAWFAEKFDIPDDEVEERIEKSFKAFLDFLEGVFVWVPPEEVPE